MTIWSVTIQSYAKEILMKYDHLISNHSVLCQRNTNEIWPFDQYITIRSYVRDTNKISPSYVYAKELALLDFAAVDFDGCTPVEVLCQLMTLTSQNVIDYC